MLEARDILLNQMELLKVPVKPNASYPCALICLQTVYFILPQEPMTFLRQDDEISKEEWKTLGQSWKDSYDADKEDLDKIREDRDEYQEVN